MISEVTVVTGWVNGDELLLLHSVDCIAVLPWSPLLGIWRTPMEFTPHKYGIFPKKERFKVDSSSLLLTHHVVPTLVAFDGITRSGDDYFLPHAWSP